MINAAARRLGTALRAVSVVFLNPDLRRLQLAWGAASFATWAFAIALGVYAFEIGGATAVGVAATIRILPGAFVSPFAGLLGDRHSRRSVLLGSAVASAAVLAAAAAAAAVEAPAVVVYALVGVATIAATPYVPAEGALMPVVARSPQELSAANVAHSFMDNLGFLAGSIITGGLLAVSGPEAVFAVGAGVACVCVVLVARLRPDQRPEYVAHKTEGVLAETARGVRELVGDAKLRLIALAIALLFFVEGAAEVLIVLVALDLLGLGQESVGYLNAAWGVGALGGGAALAVLLDRGHMATGLLVGCLLTGASLALPGLWVVAVAGYLAFLGLGAGYTFVEVAARTLLQRLGSDETLARAVASLETSRYVAMALGTIASTGLSALIGIEGTLIAIGALVAIFALARWPALRALEIGAPVDEDHYRLLRANEIFAPLPVDALERLCHDLVPRSVDAGDEIVTQGETGERFYLIAGGQVEVYEDGELRGSHSEGGSFGEIALLRRVPRTATVRAISECHLLALDRDHFIAAVTGHRRSSEAAGSVIERRLRGGSGPASAT